MRPELRRLLPLAALLVAILLGQAIAVGARLAAERDEGGRPPRAVPAGEGIPSDRARDLLCARPEPSRSPPRTGGTLPAAQQAVADDVQELRGLRFERPVHPEAVDQGEIGRRIQVSVEASFPRERMDRRTRAWRAMGVIPPDGDLAAEIRRFASSSIIGFYDTITKELVFAGSADPSPYERVTLAHELTHALDDQHFGLHRLDELDAACADDALLAGIAVAEGSARYLELLYITRKLTAAEYAQYQAESLQQGDAPQLSPFLRDLLIFPYPFGQQFVQLEQARGGQDAIDRALRELPDSTEQILHPDRFPGDEPQDVDVADVAPALGEGWEGIDVYDVGEAWLRLALGLRVEDHRATAGAHGWDGGEYRAWSDGDDVAVVMETVWDSPQDAAEFFRIMQDWLSRTASGSVTKVQRAGERVWVLWAPDQPALRAMSAALRD